MAVRREESRRLIQHCEKAPNLKVLTSGPVPPNPAELLGSEEMRKLLNILSEQYAHIIIDSPPAISFTDASILSTMVDGVILVVHGGRSSRAVVRRAKQQLLDVGAHVFGVVLNNVKVESRRLLLFPLLFPLLRVRRRRRSRSWRDRIK